MVTNRQNSRPKSSPDRQYIAPTLVSGRRTESPALSDFSAIRSLAVQIDHKRTDVLDQVAYPGLVSSVQTGYQVMSQHPVAAGLLYLDGVEWPVAGIAI